VIRPPEPDTSHGSGRVADGEGVVAIAEAAPQPTVVIAVVTNWREFPAQWGALLGEVWDVVRADGVHAGRNVMLYLDDQPTVEVGAELLGPFTPRGRIIASTLPGGRTASTTAPGSPTPHGIAAAHDAVVAFCDAGGHARTGVRWEIYSHHSDDPAQMYTEVHHALAQPA